MTTKPLFYKIILYFLLLSAHLVSAQIVTSNADDGAPGTLRSQIANAGAGDQIVFATGVTQILLVSGPITIDKTLTISANDVNPIVIDGNHTSRIFTITGSNVTLNGLTLTNGRSDEGGAIWAGGELLTINGCTISGSTATTNGGGLWNGSGIVRINNGEINGNTALGAAANNGGGGIFNNSGEFEINATVISNNKATGNGGSGGGLMSLSGSIFTSCTFDSNAANRAGGAIEITDGVLTINGGIFTNNDTDGSAGTPNPGNGGAIHISGTSAQTTIAGVIFDGNRARQAGGALWNQGSLLSVEDSTIRNNTAGGQNPEHGGGGIFNNGGNLGLAFATLHNNAANGTAGSGGAIHVRGGNADLWLVTISGNSANGNGGGIYSDAELTFDALTITANTADGNGGGVACGPNVIQPGPFKNSIIAANSASLGQDVFSSTDPFVTHGYNIVGEDDDTAMTLSMGDMTGTAGNPINVHLGPLADNGGFEMTHAILPGSPAYNAGDPSDVFTDQNGMEIFDGRRDIGSFEAQSVLAVKTFSGRLKRSAIYPNPAKGKISIALAEGFGGDATGKLMELASGKIVCEFELGVSPTTIELSYLASGIYILKLESENTAESHKLALNN